MVPEERFAFRYRNRTFVVLPGVRFGRARRRNLFGRRVQARKEALFQRFITAVKRTGAGFRMGADLAIDVVGIPLKIFAIEEVGRAGKSRGDPLPGEVVACRIAIDQVPEEPSRPRLPAHLTPVNDVGGKPKPNVIVEITRLLKVFTEAVHADEGRASGRDVGGEQVCVLAGREPRFVGFLVVPDAIAKFGIESLPVVAPGELVDELACLSWLLRLLECVVADLRKRQDAMAEIGREPGDVARDEVARTRIRLRLDLRQHFESGCASAPRRTEGGISFKVREQGLERCG